MIDITVAFALLTINNSMNEQDSWGRQAYGQSHKLPSLLHASFGRSERWERKEVTYLKSCSWLRSGLWLGARSLFPRTILSSMPGVSKLTPCGARSDLSRFHKEHLIGTQPCSFHYILTLAALAPGQQRWVVATKSAWPTKAKIFIYWLFTKFADSHSTPSAPLIEMA